MPSTPRRRPKRLRCRGSSGRCTTALFERQFALEDGHLTEYARDLGLDALRVAREIAAHTYKPQVREDFMSGVKSGVNGTPTFFINGLRYDYTWNEDTLTAALERAIV